MGANSEGMYQGRNMASFVVSLSFVVRSIFPKRNERYEICYLVYLLIVHRKLVELYKQESFQAKTTAY